MQNYSTAISEILAKNRLIIASNRGPIEHYIDESGEIRSRKGAGGLVTAMSSILETTEAVWIASAITKEDKLAAEKNGYRIDFPEGSPIFTTRYISFEEEVYRNFYGKISNPLLWFINHYLWNIPHTPLIDFSTISAWKNGYLEANNRFAETIVEEIGISGDDSRNPVVMLQDYHLLTCAKRLRSLSDCLIFHFIHIPWPQPDYFRILPDSIREEILLSLLSCNLVGFHCSRYSKNFMLCCEEFVECEVDFHAGTVCKEGNLTKIRSYPISIDPEKLMSSADEPEVLKWEDKFNETRRDFLIVRIDRMEPSKNVLRGFQSYDLFLDRFPEFKRRINFLAMMYSSRGELYEYQNYEQQVQKLVDEINAKHGSPGWYPIIYWLEDNFARSVAAMKLYDVLLVNPVFDGMNLVAKEGPLLNTKDGVLLLSENAGAHFELSDAAMTINPFDIDGCCQAIQQALLMDAGEKKARAGRLREIVSHNNIYKWLYHQLEDIVEVEG